MKNTILLLVFIISTTLSAQTSNDKVKELMRVMEIDKMMDGMMPAMLNQAKASLKTKEHKEQFVQIQKMILEETKKFGKKTTNHYMVELYSKHFTSNEIDDMITFYKSDTGKKMLEKTPIITSEMMQQMMSKEIPELQANIKIRTNEILNSSNKS